MRTLYKINSDALNESFIAAIKAKFPHQNIEISVSQVEDNEPADYVSPIADSIKKSAGILSSSTIDPMAWQRAIRDEWEDRL